MSDLRIEVDPDKVAAIGAIWCYQNSTPRGGPQSYSGIRVPSGIPSRSSSSVIRFLGFAAASDCFTSAILPLPFGTHSTGSPTGSAACATSSSGISTVSVFPTRTMGWSCDNSYEIIARIAMPWADCIVRPIRHEGLLQSGTEIGYRSFFEAERGREVVWLPQDQVSVLQIFRQAQPSPEARVLIIYGDRDRHP